MYITFPYRIGSILTKKGNFTGKSLSGVLFWITNSLDDFDIDSYTHLRITFMPSDTVKLLIASNCRTS